VERPLVTVCTTKAEPWVDAGVTDELLKGLRAGDSTEVVPLVAVWLGEGWLPRADASVTNELPSGIGGGQLLPREARPCDWVADPGRLASVLGWGTPGETILGARRANPGRRSSWEAARASGSKSSLVFLYRRVETGREF